MSGIGTRYIGKPARRVDAQEKVMGKAKYVGDMKVPGMLYARAFRSQVPSAAIRALNVSPALAVPGVCAVITNADLHDGGMYGFPVKDQYVLVRDRVRRVGDPIAVVAAETPEAALAGVEAIVCELEPLPALFDPECALEPGAPQIGPDRADGKHPNFVERHIVRKEDPLATAATCPVVQDEYYTTCHQEHAYIETEGALAIPTPDGGVVVYCSNQSPFINHSVLVNILGLPPTQVRVIQPPVGGSFGGKDDLNYESSSQVASLAIKTGRPVRMTFSREESMVASYKRDAMRMHIRLGADADGTLRACKFEGLMDSGAYASQTVFTGWRASIHAMGAYRYDACDVDVSSVYTNNGYCGAFRGFGNTEVSAGIEQAIDEMAEKVGKDPIDFRLQNCLRLGDETPHGQILTESVGLPECLRRVREASDWDRKRQAFAGQTGERRRGIGVAALFHGTSLGAEGTDYAGSTISVEHDHSITLTSGITDYGPGSRTVFTLIAAEELGVDPARIRMLRPDTNTAIESGPTVASRSTMIGGNAARFAARNLAQTIDLAAADLLGCELYQMVRHGEAFVGPSEEPVPWECVVDHARDMGLVPSAVGKWTAPKIEWDHHKGRGTPYIAYHFGAHVAEVEVDTRTGKVDLVGFWAVHDPGVVIFPQGAYGQVCGGIAQGVGYALYEQVTFANGYLQETNYDTYLIPTAVDLPEIHVDFVEESFSHGPYGAKNVAEPALVPAAPAVLNAIAHATGRRIRDLPANLERVLLGHDLAREGSASSCKIGLRTS
jgi:CO/xanthine dehydrogenase Mo-binding subunit